MKELTVFVLYKAKPGKLAALQAKLGEHAPVLRNLGLLSERPEMIIEMGEGCFMEIVEWANDGAAQRAHDIKEVQEIWGAFAELADFVTFKDLPSAVTEKPFAKATMFNSKPRASVYSDNMLSAKNYKSLVAFYRDSIGLYPSVAREDFTILIDQESGQRLCITSGPSNGRFSPGISSKKLDSTITQMTQLGAKVLKQWEYPGMIGANVEDPEGNEIVVWESKRG